MGNVEDADALAVALAWLRSHTETVDAWGGADHITGLIEAPWPHLRVSEAPGGDLGTLVYDADVALLLEGYGDPAGTTGFAALRRLVLLAARALSEAPGSDTALDQPELTYVRAAGGLAPLTMPNGQQKYALTVLVGVVPPRQS